jgi:serine/threonine-protein kinase RsbW
MISHNINDCGILLATSPASWKFRGIPSEGNQRISVVLSFKYIDPPKTLKLYPPAHHRDMIVKLYQNISAPAHEFASSDAASLTLAEESVLETGANESESCAEIFVHVYGKNIVHDVHRKLREFCIQKIA